MLNSCSYETIVRSHVAAISGLCCTNAEEVASISEDKTMRVWNLNTGLQSVEFLCESDTPKCICYHPTKKLLFCGFESGFIRVFDASEASTLFEINIRKGYSIREMQFVNLDSVVLLVVLDQIGTITVLDERTNFTQLSSVDLDIGASANSNKLISGGLSPFIAVLSPNSTSILSIPELQVISLDNSDRENGEDESLHRLIDLQFLSVDGHQFILTLATKHLTLYKLEKYGTNNFICKRRMMKSWDFGALISGFINPSQQLMFLHFKQRPKTVEVSPLKGTRSFSHSKASKLEDNFANVICQKFEVLIPDSLGRIKLSQPFGLNSLMNFSRSCLSAELQKIVTVDSNGGLLIWKIDMERVFNCEREFENESKKVIQIDCSPLPSKTVVFDHETSSVSPAEECSVNSKDSTTSAESDEREIMLMGRESKQEESFNPIVCEISLESLENLHPETMNDSKIDCDKVEEVAKDEVVEYNLNSSAVHEYQFYTLLPELEVTNAWAKVTQWRELLKDFSFVVSFGENKFVFDRIVRNERKHFGKFGIL